MGEGAVFADGRSVLDSFDKLRAFQRIGARERRVTARFRTVYLRGGARIKQLKFQPRVVIDACLPVPHQVQQ